MRKYFLELFAIGLVDSEGRINTEHMTSDALMTSMKTMEELTKMKMDRLVLEPVSEIDKKYQELLETLSPEQEEVITEYCNAIFSSGADTEKFFYRLGLKDGLNLKNTVKSVLEMIS
jgi:hypothetical protein